MSRRRRTALLLAGGALAVTGVAGSATAGSQVVDHQPPVTRAYLTGPEGDLAEGGSSTGPVRVRLEAFDTGPGRLARTDVRVDGGAWRAYRRPTPEVLFDGTAASFRRWRHLGAGSFVLQGNGTMRTSGGLGMLWYPGLELGSVEVHLRWRALPAPGGSAAGSSHGNSGLLVRFPDPVAAVRSPHPCQAGVGLATQGLVLPEWAAIDCGNEVQINDSSAADPQRTGSVYDFSFLHDPQQRPVRAGTWTDYVVRVVGGGDYAVTVVRDGHVINEWVNTPGQVSWRSGCYCAVPAENPLDAPSDLRQFARGYLGLQNHSGTDVVEFGRVTVQDLSGDAGAFTVRGAGEHLVEFRSTDAAGNREPLQRVRFDIGPATGVTPPARAPAGCSVGPVVLRQTPVSCSYVASGDGAFDARTTGTWTIRVTRGRTTWLVATHSTAPAQPVSGRFHARAGDRVTVTLGPDLVSPRDNNVTAEGSAGTLTVGDAPG